MVAVPASFTVSMFFWLSLEAEASIFSNFQMKISFFGLQIRSPEELERSPSNM